jgi:hypothetical protein
MAASRDVSLSMAAARCRLRQGTHHAPITEVYVTQQLLLPIHLSLTAVEIVKGRKKL